MFASRSSTTGSVPRRRFLRDVAFASGSLTLAATGACAQGETAPSNDAGAGESESVSPPEFELYHEAHGEGPALVFAHGAGGTHMSWWRQIPTFSQEFTCITYAQRGFGLSPDIPGGPGRSSFVEDLRGLLDRLGIERARLIGQSMGGRSVLGFAAAYPERVDALVMSSTTGGYNDAEMDAVRAEAPDLGPRSAFAPSYEERDPEGAFLYRMVSRTNQHLAGPQDDRAAVDVPAPDIQRILDAGVKTLFLVGERDTVVPPTVIRAFQAKMTGSTLVSFPESGHSPYWEIPDQFNAAVLDFLRA